VWEIEEYAGSERQLSFITIEERSFLHFGARQISARGVGQLNHRSFEERRFKNRECFPRSNRDDTGIIDAQLPRDGRPYRAFRIGKRRQSLRGGCTQPFQEAADFLWR